MSSYDSLWHEKLNIHLKKNATASVSLKFLSEVNVGAKRYIYAKRQPH